MIFGSILDGIKDYFNNVADSAVTYTTDHLKIFGDPAMMAASMTLASPFGLAVGYALGGAAGAITGGLAAPMGIILGTSLVSGVIGAFTALTTGERCFHEEDYRTAPVPA